MTDLAASWEELHDAKPEHWLVGRPSYNEQRKLWEMYAYDGRERRRPAIGRASGQRSRSPSWT